jgi:hypothetical protein
MKRFAVLNLVAAFTLTLCSYTQAAECPFGLVDDPYPGECGRYIDENNDGICDLSQDIEEQMKPSEHSEDEAHEEEYSVEISGSELKIMTIAQIANLWEIDAQSLLNATISQLKLSAEEYTVDSTIDELRKESKFAPSQIKEIAESVKTGNVQTTSLDETMRSSIVAKTNPYNFPLPFFGTLIIFIFLNTLSKSSLAKKYKVFGTRNIRLFWNVVLVITLIPSMLFGVFLIGAYQFPFFADLRKFLLFWHVEGSIVFGTVCILHFVERFRLFAAPIKNLFRNKL